LLLISLIDTTDYGVILSHYLSRLIAEIT